MVPPIDFSKLEQLKTTADLPSPKGVAVAIVQATQREDVSMADLARIIKTDPAFAGRLIKAANGATGYGRRAIASVQDALLVLGLPAVRNLALGFSLLSQHRSGHCAAFDYEAFWSASLVQAVTMQALVLRSRVAPSDEAYCVGLLARVGELALATIFPQRYDAILRLHRETLGTSLSALELEGLAMTHSELGAAMLADWGIPRAFTEPVYYSETLDEAPFEDASRERTLTCSLAFSRHIAAACLCKPAERPLALVHVEASGAALALEKPAIRELCEHVLREWHEWGALLQVKVPPVQPFFSETDKPVQNVATLPLATAPAPSPSGSDRTRVLLVDADTEARRTIRMLVEESGHEVLETDRAEQAAELVLTMQPQMMIVDWNLPGVTSVKMIERLRQTRVGRSVYVLVLTNHEDEQRLVEAFECGVDDFMTKPVNPRVLGARLRAGSRVIKLHQEIERDREEIRHFAAELAVSNRRLQEVALSDPLTGFPNRRYFLDRLNQEWAASARYSRELACLVIDLDQFKLVNDTYGHDVGDAVLRQTALSLKRALRAQDVIARTGGDEFLVLCPDTSHESACVAAERARQMVESTLIQVGVLQLRITVSVGVAVRKSVMVGAETLVQQADEQMAIAKKAGRNRVAAAGKPAKEVAFLR